jgi:hypothetical protein
MTQIVTCSTHEGIVLATDSRAAWFNSAGETGYFSLKKLLSLGSNSAMMSAGRRSGRHLFAPHSFGHREIIAGEVRMKKWAILVGIF